MTSTSTSTRSQVIMAHIFCVAQQFTAVTVYVLGKKILDTVGVHHFVFIRLLFVVPAVFLVASLFTRSFNAFKVQWRTLGFIALSGIIGILISQSLVFVGLDMSTATNASIISAPCTPLFTALFSVIRGTDKMNIPKACGFLFSTIGALLLLQVWNFDFQGKTLGNLLIVASSVCSAVNSLLQKHILNKGHHPLVIQTYVCSIGMVAYIIGYSGFGLFEPKYWVISGNVWIYICIVGVVATALPWCIGIIALKHTSPMTTSVYVVLQPLISGVVGVVILGEVLTWIQVLGSLLVLSGLVLVNAQPIVQRLLSRFRTKVEFELLPSEDAKEVEMQVVVEEKDGADTKPTEEVNYDLVQKGETNDFVIEDTPDYKPVDGIFTPEFVRMRHGEDADGYNFSVTLKKPMSDDVSAAVRDGDGADYMDVEKDANFDKNMELVDSTPTTRRGV